MSRAKSSSVTAFACPIGQLKLLLTISCHACDIPPKNADRETSVGLLLLLLLLSFVFLSSLSRINLSRRFRPAPILILFYQNSSGVSRARLASRARFLNVIIQAPGVPSDRYGWRSRYTFRLIWVLASDWRVLRSPAPDCYYYYYIFCSREAFVQYYVRKIINV